MLPQIRGEVGVTNVTGCNSPSSPRIAGDFFLGPEIFSGGEGNEAADEENKGKYGKIGREDCTEEVAGGEDVKEHGRAFLSGGEKQAFHFGEQPPEEKSPGDVSQSKKPD
jgi:hypothetical protein